MAKITPDVSNSFWYLHAVQELGDSFRVSETYLEPCQKSKMERFAKIVNSF